MADHQDHLDNDSWGIPGVDYQATYPGMAYSQILEFDNPLGIGFSGSEPTGQAISFDVVADNSYITPHYEIQPEGTLLRSTLVEDDQVTRDSQSPRSAMNEVQLHDDNWTYAIEVQPAFDELGKFNVDVDYLSPTVGPISSTQRPTIPPPIVHHFISIVNILQLISSPCRAANGTCFISGQHHVENNKTAIDQQLKYRSIPYDLVIARPVEGSGICRQYALQQKDRFNHRVRLEFLQVFTANRTYNRNLPGYSFRMSVVFKDRVVLPSGPYPSGIDGRQDSEGENRFSPGSSIHGLVVYSGGEDQVLLPVSPSSNGLDSPSPFEPPLSPPESLSTPGHRHQARPPRTGPIVKPNRIATKNREGKFVCTFPGCTDDVKIFGRKCEWSKHMDKHDRPYKCLAVGCEKLSGFTYSGGLLRHEREVHNKHGGPKNPLNCPHGNCKRHEGKGFSRMENLNEHLRRVHTPNDANSGPAVAQTTEDELEENPTPLQQGAGSEKTGEKRKPETDLREEVKRLHQENQQLKNEVRAQSLHSMAMMQTIEEISKQLRVLSNSKSQPQGQIQSRPGLQLELPSEGASKAQSETEADIDLPNVAPHTGLSSLG
ncbi:hypothetical protein F5Y11DRAFT_365634 [Daldinia sp. FL1419]|nr:hypothetical protein F5Y11DRAFT_365634 [Daldinia sp. FL1419]